MTIIVNTMYYYLALFDDKISAFYHQVSTFYYKFKVEFRAFAC
jgi:hypothetical protein